MPNYLFRPDRGPVERFDAVSDAAARDYCLEVLADGWCDDDESVSLYRVDDGGRGDDEFVAEVRLGDEPEEDDSPVPCYWRQGHPID